MHNRNAIRRLRRYAYNSLRKLSYLPYELWDAFFADRNELRPPRSKTFIYGYDPEFQNLGQEFLAHFRKLADLQPDEDLLDIGSGIGRVAIPLTKWLSAQGSYHGLDIVADGVGWCQQNITPKFPNFHFTRANVYNATYNPGGRFAARDYRFPYEDASFDFAWTKSVYTHMLADDVENYLRETVRVLRPGGRCLNTFFILNEDALAHMRAGKSMFDFQPYQAENGEDENGKGESWVVSQDEPEKAIAFTESFIRKLYAACGLQIVEPLHWGGWCGRQHFLSGQDVVVAFKP